MRDRTAVAGDDEMSLQSIMRGASWYRIVGMMAAFIASSSARWLNGAMRSNPIELIGWASSCVLVLTIGAQVYKQWHDDTSKGVSPWLSVGEVVASGGFCTYSILIKNWVFVVTNAMLTIYGMLGIALYARHKRRGKAG